MADTKASALTTIPVVDRAADLLYVIDISGASSNNVTPNVLLGITGDPLGHTDTQTVSNKTIGNTNTVSVKDSLFTLQDNSDTTKQVQFQLSGITTATTRTLTIPDATDTIVTLAATQTLTNKTLTSPTINTATIANPTLTVNTISEYTAANGVTVDGLSIKDGKLNTNDSVVTANITDGAVTPSKLATGSTGSSVATSQATASATYTDLATAGPAVTATIGANGMALVGVTSLHYASASDAYHSFAVSGASTVAASDTYATSSNGTAGSTNTTVTLLTGLTAGSNTFTSKYRAAAGTGTFLNRTIWVLPL